MNESINTWNPPENSTVFNHVWIKRPTIRYDIDNGVYYHDTNADTYQYITNCESIEPITNNFNTVLSVWKCHLNGISILVNHGDLVFSNNDKTCLVYHSGLKLNPYEIVNESEVFEHISDMEKKLINCCLHEKEN